jgi:hypothetical protein
MNQKGASDHQNSVQNGNAMFDQASVAAAAAQQS